MFKSILRRWLTGALTVAIGLSLCFAPSAAAHRTESVPAVSGPSPMSQAIDLVSIYDDAVSALAPYTLTLEQRHTLINRMDQTLSERLAMGVVTQTELDYRSLPHYREEFAPRYQRFAQAQPALTPAEVVTQVNMDLDCSFYASPTPADDPDSLTVLVNKHHALGPDHIPQLELLGAGYGTGALKPEAAAAFRAMADAALADGIQLKSVSAYRSYTTQKLLYERYLIDDPQSVVDDFSARPGHSEHQTGLALDINVARSSAHFEDTAEYAWLQENCARFGFILRYPQDKEHITGYRFEPWHYRYVGAETARQCAGQQLTFEEYTALQKAEDLSHLPALYVDGVPIAPSREAVCLNGLCYYPADSIAAHTGWESSEMISANSLVLYRDARRITLIPGLRYYRDMQVVPLGYPALDLDGRLYLTLEDLSETLGFCIEESPLGLELVF